MEKMTCKQFESGRHFVGRLPHGKDLATSIELFCKENSIFMGTFSVIGAVSSATMGIYDQKQQVYVTMKVDSQHEILLCTGNISLKDGNPFVHAHISLSDELGKTIGGHLFSETIVFAGEIYLQELRNNPLERTFDKTTGLMLWDIT